MARAAKSRTCWGNTRSTAAFKLHRVALVSQQKRSMQQTCWKSKWDRARSLVKAVTCPRARSQKKWRLRAILGRVWIWSHRPTTTTFTRLKIWLNSSKSSRRSTRRHAWLWRFRSSPALVSLPWVLPKLMRILFTWPGMMAAPARPVLTPCDM